MNRQQYNTTTQAANSFKKVLQTLHSLKQNVKPIWYPVHDRGNGGG